MEEIISNFKYEQFKYCYLSLPKYATKNNLSDYQITILKKYLGEEYLKIINFIKQ